MEQTSIVRVLFLLGASFTVSSSHGNYSFIALSQLSVCRNADSLGKKKLSDMSNGLGTATKLTLISMTKESKCNE